MINLSNNARHPEQIIEFKADKSVEEFVNQVKNGFPVGKVGSWTFKENTLRVHLDSGGDIELREERKGFRRGTSTNFDQGQQVRSHVEQDSLRGSFQDSRLRKSMTRSIHFFGVVL